MTASIAAAASADYFLNEADRGLYYLTGNASGVWYGDGAASLGFVGEIVAEEFRAAFEGLTPDGSHSLVQVQEGKVRQPATDITFSAPKSVSALWSQASTAHRRQIEDVLLRAAKRALDYLNSEALVTRRGANGQRVERAMGVYALCLHGTSRALDPQLHIHALAFNLCLRRDGTTGTIRSKDLYQHKMAAGAVFRYQLAHLLEKELGLEVVKEGWSFKVAGVSQDLCVHQSKRRQEIHAAAQEYGWSSPHTLAKLAIETRGPKGQVTLEECFDHWAKEGQQFGFTRDDADRLFAQGRQRIAERALSEATSTEAAVDLKRPTAKAIRDISAFHAYFPERDVVCQVANDTVGHGLSASELLKSVKGSLERFEQRLDVRQPPYIYYSTQENIAAEKELLDRIEKGKASERHLVDERTLKAAQATVEQSLSKKLGTIATLTTDQEKALRHIVLEPGSLKLVQGYAGTGKTQMLEAAKQAWKAKELDVIGVSVTGKAALGLEAATGIRSVTVDSLLRQLRPELSPKEKAKLYIKKSSDILKANYWASKRAGAWLRNPFRQALRELAEGAKRAILDRSRDPQPIPQLSHNSILVVDEMGMLPTRTLLALKQECDKVGAKMVGVGDRLQLPPIEAGGPFWSIANRIGHASLTTIIRQRQEWMREAVGQIIKNQPAKALELYAKNGALHFEKTPRAAIEKLVADYSKVSAKDVERCIAITATRDEAYRINRAVQAQRKAKRELGLTSLRLPNGDRVYKHDRIMITRNDYQLGVRNGLLATVVQLHRTRGIMGPGAITVRLDGSTARGLFRVKPRLVTIDLKNKHDRDHITLGYAATTHKVQGITVERSFVLMGDSAPSRELAFTQLSRASHDTSLYAVKPVGESPLAQLARQMTKTSAKDLAHDHTLLPHKEKCHDRSL